MRCKETQNPDVKHEWLLDRAEAVRVANYLRGFGFQVTCKPYVLPGLVNSYYVGVPFQSLKE